MMYCIRPLLLGMVFLFTATNLASKTDAADGGYYTTKDKEFYLTSDEIYFIRPGLELEILDVTIPADRQLEVTFKLSDPGGLPLDRNGVFTPGPVSTSFVLSYIPQGEEAYVAYTTRVQTSPITGDSAVQGSADSGGTYTDLGEGQYKYKFNTVLPPDYDTDATHTLGIYARRDLREFDLDRYVTNELEHFVPSGIDTPAPRDIVKTETCNRCHDPLAAHGGARTEVGLCVLCHNPTQGIDPDTGSLVDMPTMIHKIHNGANLENGYTVIGYRQRVHDYGEVVFPAEINDCEICHTGGTPTENFPLVANPNPVEVCDASQFGITDLTWGDIGALEIRVGATDGPLFASSGGMGSQQTGKWVRDGTVFFLQDKGTGETVQVLPVNATVLGCLGNAPGTFRGAPGEQHTNWLDKPSRLNCGSCHDAVDFETGEGHSRYEIVQPDDNFCSNCHQPDSGSDFDWSIRGAHKPLYKSAQFPGVLLKFIDITNTNPGDTPTVTFSLGSKNARLRPDSLNRLVFTITGPNDDFNVRIRETVGSNATQAGDNWTYTFNTPIPEDALGSFTVSVEGRNNVTIDFGEEESVERDQMEPSLLAFAVTDDVAVPRRIIVDDAKCENCHSNLSLHGDNRKNANYCATCHQPGTTDEAVRPPENLPTQSVHLKYLIHKIHRGAELEKGFVVFGYRGSVHDFSDIEFPGDLSNCDSCHVNDSQQLPLPKGLLATTTPQEFWDPMLPVASACLSCHDDDDAAAHAYVNTAFFGESCATCHGDGMAFSVDKVHAK